MHVILKYSSIRIEVTYDKLNFKSNIKKKSAEIDFMNWDKKEENY